MIWSESLQTSECDTNKLSQPSHSLWCTDDQHREDDSRLVAGGTHGIVCLANITRQLPAWLPSLGQNMCVFVCVAAVLQLQVALMRKIRKFNTNWETKADSLLSEDSFSRPSVSPFIRVLRLKSSQNICSWEWTKPERVFQYLLG